MVKSSEDIRALTAEIARRNRSAQEARLSGAPLEGVFALVPRSDGPWRVSLFPSEVWVARLYAPVRSHESASHFPRGRPLVRDVWRFVRAVRESFEVDTTDAADATEFSFKPETVPSGEVIWDEEARRMIVRMTSDLATRRDLIELALREFNLNQVDPAVTLVFTQGDDSRSSG